jgi:hypothetical protein
MLSRRGWLACLFHSPNLPMPQFIIVVGVCPVSMPTWSQLCRYQAKFLNTRHRWGKIGVGSPEVWGVWPEVVQVF